MRPLCPSSVLPLALGLCLLAGCASAVPRVDGSEAYLDSLRRWDSAMSQERAGAGLPREAHEVPPTIPAETTEPEPAALPQVVDDPTAYAFTLRDVDLGQAFMLVGEQAGLNVLLDGDFSQPVQLNLPAARLQAVVETLARTYGCTLEVADDIVLVHRDDPSVTSSRVFVLRSSSAAEVQPQLATLVGEASVVVNPGRNVVMVTADAARMRDVERYLLAVDQPDRQVLIEARILEIDRSDLLELGSAIANRDVQVDSWTASFVTDLLSSSPSVVAGAGDATGDVDVTLDLLRSLMNLEILQRPRLIALHGREARLEILSEVPYVKATTTTESNVSTVGSQTIQEVEFKMVGLELSITPTIQDDGLVSLVVDQRVSVQTGTFNQIPVVDSRTIATSFVVREGDTIMIGGIMKNTQLQEREGVPGLMDIPLLGGLFRHDADSGTSQELVILMTPRLVDPRSLPPDAASQTVKIDLEQRS